MIPDVQGSFFFNPGYFRVIGLDALYVCQHQAALEVCILLSPTGAKSQKESNGCLHPGKGWPSQRKLPGIRRVRRLILQKESSRILKMSNSELGHCLASPHI